MIKYNYIGFWKPFWPTSDHNFDPDFDPFLLEEKVQILEHLKKCYVVLKTRKVSTCLIDKKTGIYSSVSSDGNWVWTSALVHYFEHFDLPLPISFVEHIKESKEMLTPLSPTEKDRIVSAIFSNGFNLM